MNDFVKEKGKPPEDGRPGASAGAEATTTNRKRRWRVVAIVTLLAAGVASSFASPHPDGLERVAEDHGFLDQAKEPSWSAWIPDYELPGVPSPWLRVGLAGLIGAALLFGVLYGLGRPLASGRREAAAAGEQDDRRSP
ncbi:PDGLE domain-containing protein [Cohnella hongkongensis]|uniref:PDGLE domain-containing protein n=1 Tax=Cohnella hongkongensis TaxID=178337 RepID=A0ABV9FF83_9BACL